MKLSVHPINGTQDHAASDDRHVLISLTSNSRVAPNNTELVCSRKRRINA